MIYKVLGGGEKKNNNKTFDKNAQRRSQDGGGIGRGDHFVSYKFIERTIER